MLPGMATSERTSVQKPESPNGELRFTRRGSGAQAWEARATGLAHGVTILRGYGSQNSVNASCSA